MTQQQIWAMYFAGIASIRFHPRNEITDVPAEVEYATRVADLMLAAHNYRWEDPPWHGSAQQ